MRRTVRARGAFPRRGRRTIVVPSLFCAPRTIPPYKVRIYFFFYFPRSIIHISNRLFRADFREIDDFGFENSRSSKRFVRKFWEKSTETKIGKFAIKNLAEIN